MRGEGSRTSGMSHKLHSKPLDLDQYPRNHLEPLDLVHVPSTNHIPWDCQRGLVGVRGCQVLSRRLGAYGKPDRKFLENFILHGPYVRRIIVEPGNPDRTPPVPESTHEQTDDELTTTEAKQPEADDQRVFITLREDTAIA
ncbi:hypothetical protein Tco_0783530 [Tanacetum coccineum]